MLLCGCVHLRWRHPCVQQGQQHPQALPLLRTMRHTIVPDVITYNGVICVCKEGQQHQQALCLLRAIQRHAAVPVAIIYTAAIGACGRAGSTSRPYIFWERCSTVPSCRM